MAAMAASGTNATTRQVCPNVVFLALFLLPFETFTPFPFPAISWIFLISAVLARRSPARYRSPVTASLGPKRLQGACTGRSASFSPLRMRSTYVAARRKLSVRSTPWDSKPPTSAKNARWQRAAELLLAEADVAAFSKAVELALFYDAILDVAAMA